MAKNYLQDISIIEDDTQFGVQLSKAFTDIMSTDSSIRIPYTVVGFSQDELPYINLNFKELGKQLNLSLTEIVSIDSNTKSIIQENIQKVYGGLQ